MPLRFALLGAGRIGQVHARTLANNQHADLVVVADALDSMANAIAELYGCAVATINEIAADETIDGVLICTPTNTHADLIELFAKSGKAVFCEKPIDLSVGRVQSCLETVQRCEIPLMLGFNRRFDPHFNAVIQTIKEEKIGAVEQVVITSRDPGLPPHEYIAVSGGIFRDMTIHDLDLARVLLGEEVETVQASASAIIDPSIRELNDYDTASLILTTASGKQALISNSRRATYGYDQRIEVHGSKGSISAKNQRPIDIEIANADGYTLPPLHDFFMSRYVDAYANEINAFVDAINKGTPPSPSGQDGLMALCLAEAALASIETAATSFVQY